jgi:prepilin-type N-terminal cleavage/methylation domain-containing protein
MTRRSRGYSLIEVLIAVAVTGFVLLTVVTLFYMGRRNVYSGKQMTYAVSVGTRVMEDLSTMTTADVMSNFAITDATAQQTVVLCSYNLLPLGTTTCTMPAGNLPGYATFANATERDTDHIGTLDPGGYLGRWQQLVTTSNLTNGRVGLVIRPRNPSSGPNPWSTARFMRIRVVVQWDEGSGHTRAAYFDTTKINR